ncbi:SoxR reducing system RseC family protein [bacterium]|nr:SoxR reducing system RseC family protein [bacterium]
MREKGKIITVNDNMAVVELTPHMGCKSCAMSEVCRTTGSGLRRLNVNTSGIRISSGDYVEVETPAKTVVTAAFLIFVLPLLISGAAYILIEKFTDNPGLGIAGFFLFFIISEFLLWAIDKIAKKIQFFRPSIVNPIEKIKN